MVCSLFSKYWHRTEYSTQLQFLLRSESGAACARAEQDSVSVPAFQRKVRGLRPGLGPSRGHPALPPTPSATGPVRLACLRIAARGRAVLLFPSPYHGVLAVKGGAPMALASWRPASPPDCCAAPCWRRFRAIPPVQPEITMRAFITDEQRFLLLA